MCGLRTCFTSWQLHALVSTVMRFVIVTSPAWQPLPSGSSENTKLLHQPRYRQEIAYTLTAHVVAVTVPMNKIHLWSSISTYRAFCWFLCGFPDGHLIIVYLFFHAPAPPGNLRDKTATESTLLPSYTSIKYQFCGLCKANSVSLVMPLLSVTMLHPIGSISTYLNHNSCDVLMRIQIPSNDISIFSSYSSLLLSSFSKILILHFSKTLNFFMN